MQNTRHHTETSANNMVISVTIGTALGRLHCPIGTQHKAALLKI